MGMYIEPCCAHKQMPRLLNENKGGVVTFQTSGDVTVMKMMDAVSYLAGQTHEMVLMVPEIDVKLLRHIRHFVVRGWATKVTLLLNDLCGMSDAEIIAGLEGTEGRVFVFYDKMVCNGLLSFAGEDGTVVIQGDMLTRMAPGLRMYAAAYGKDGRTWEMLQPVMSKAKVKVVAGKGIVPEGKGFVVK